jgi:hypothetical protein
MVTMIMMGYPGWFSVDSSSTAFQHSTVTWIAASHCQWTEDKKFHHKNGFLCNATAL